MTAGNFFNGEYAVTTSNLVVDKEGKPVVSYSGILSVSDKTRPVVDTQVTYPNNNKATVKFSEPVNVADGTALEGKVTIKDKTGATVANTGLFTLAADKKSFDINVAGFVANDTYTLTFVGIADFNGNLISPNPTTAQVVKTAPDTVDPTVTSVEAINNSSLKVKFSEAIDTTAANIFSIDIGATGTPEAIQLADVTPSTDKTEFTINLAGLTTAAFQAPSGLKRVDVTAFTDLSGRNGVAFNKIVSFTADTTGPVVTGTTVETIGGKRHIVVKFNETIALTAANLSAKYVQDGVEKTLTIDASAVTAYDSNADTKLDAIKIDTTNYDGAGTVDLLPSGAYTITLPANLVADTASNNNLQTNVTATIGNTSEGDTTKPVVSSVTVQAAANDTVVVVFNEEVTNATALVPANYTVEGRQVFESAIFDGDKKTVRLTLKAGEITLNGDMNVEVKNVKDVAGNTLDNYSVVKTFKENVKPVLNTGSMANTDLIKLTFSEGLTAASVANTDFTVKVNGTTVTSTGVFKADGSTALANGDKDVYLKLTAPIAALTDDVKVTVAAAAIKDANGNDNAAEVTVDAQ